MTRVHGVQPGESLRAEHFLLLVAGGDGERCKAGQATSAASEVEGATYEGWERGLWEQTAVPADSQRGDSPSPTAARGWLPPEPGESRRGVSPRAFR